MAFQKFTESGKGYKPKISIRSSGSIGLNGAALKKFGLDERTSVFLYFDPDTRKIAIGPAGDEEEGAHRIHLGKTGGMISAKRFLDFWDYDYGKTMHYECSYDEKDGMIILEKPAGVRGEKKESF